MAGNYRATIVCDLTQYLSSDFFLEVGRSHTTNAASLSLFNARSVGTSRKRTEICNLITDNNVDMFLTETWLRPSGDEAKCADLAPPGYTVHSFPRSPGAASWPWASLYPPPPPGGGGGYHMVISGYLDHQSTQFRLSASELLLFVSVVLVLINALYGIPNCDDLVS